MSVSQGAELLRPGGDDPEAENAGLWLDSETV